MPRTLVTFAFLLLVIGCRAYQQPPASLPGLVQTADIEALVSRGCYRCLARAYDLAIERGARQHGFEAAALLVLRSKELGLSPAVWLERAATLAGDDGGWTMIVEIVAAIPLDPLSGDREAALAQGSRSSRAAALVPLWREALTSSGSSAIFRAYVDVAMGCTLVPSGPREGVEDDVDSLPDVPILQYRLGVCSVEHGARLRRVRASDEEFVDADYALGRYELARTDTPNQEEAMRRLRAAANAFPESPAIATTIGNLYENWEEWLAALDAYDAALAQVSSHPDALLGRTIALSQLARAHDAIETASRLIEGRWFVGQGHYWRAWNHLQLGDLEGARVDADNARRLMVNARVFLLSGLVDWRLTRRESAEKEFENALSMDFGECDAALFLGGVRAELKKAPEALAALIQARRCYDLAISLRRRLIEEIAASATDARTKARQIASHERAIRDNDSRRADAIRAAGELETFLKTPQPSAAEVR